MHLFVYGTLKRNQSRHRFLTGQTFVEIARTRPQYRIRDAGSYPALVRSENGLAIEGELWEIDARCLSILDRVEGCDVGLYERRSIELAPPHDRIEAVSYFYLQDHTQLRDCGTLWPN